MDLKVGDKVRAIKTWGSKISVGDEGIVEEVTVDGVQPGVDRYKVKFGKMNHLHISASLWMVHLELIDDTTKRSPQVGDRIQAANDFCGQYVTNAANSTNLHFVTVMANTEGEIVGYDAAVDAYTIKMDSIQDSFPLTSEHFSVYFRVIETAGSTSEPHADIPCPKCGNNVNPWNVEEMETTNGRCWWCQTDLTGLA